MCWTSDVFDINRMCDPLIEHRGWDVNVLQFPAAMHIAVTLAHTAPGIVEAFLKDLAASAAELMQNPNEKVCVCMCVCVCFIGST